MRFPNAYKGVKKVFVSEIVSIVVALLLVVTAILVLIGLQNEPAMVAGGTLGLVAGIAALVAFIIRLVGLFQGGKDELQLRYALYVVIAAVVLSLVGTILTALPNAVANTIGKILSTLSEAFGTVAIVYTLFGISHLSSELGNEEMAYTGRKLAYIVTALFVMSVVLGLFPDFFINGKSSVVQTLFGVFGIVAAIAELVAYILTVIYYARATKMLKAE